MTTPADRMERRADEAVAWCDLLHTARRLLAAARSEPVHWNDREAIDLRDAVRALEAE